MTCFKITKLMYYEKWF